MRLRLTPMNATVDIKPIEMVNKSIKSENFTQKNLTKEVKKTLPFHKLWIKNLKTELIQMKESFELIFRNATTNRMMSVGVFSWLNTGGLPKELIDLATTIVLGLLALIVILAIINSLIASAMTMCNKKSEAEEWHANIRRGLVQALTAIVVIVIFCALADFLFGGTKGYHPVLSPK